MVKRTSPSGVVSDAGREGAVMAVRDRFQLVRSRLTTAEAVTVERIDEVIRNTSRRLTENGGSS